MNTNPMISIIVPVYNVEKYLPQCIDSILAQSFTQFELLLIDDGTPDRSGDICEEYAKRDTRIRVFHQENGGLSRARNVGLEEAKGDFISFVDSDDYIKSDYLADLYNACLHRPGKEGVVIGAFEKVFPDKIIPVLHQDTSLEPFEFYRLLTELIDKYVMYTHSKLFSRHLIVINNIRFVPDVSGTEDMLFLLDYCLCADYILIKNFNNYSYRVGYSTEVLSVRINSYPKEFLAYKEYLNRLLFYKKRFSLTDLDMMVVWKKSLTTFVHKVILAIYRSGNRYSRRKRLLFLHELLSSEYDVIEKYFFPTYKIDKIGKYFLLHEHYTTFDCYMYFLFKIKFKKMFM